LFPETTPIFRRCELSPKGSGPCPERHVSRSQNAVQRVCEVSGSVKDYLRSPECLVTAETRRCPFCPDAHPLRLHGWYGRQALLPYQGTVVRVWVRRLCCAVTGKTVSLLPDFCLPRRQHGPGILGVFLQAFVSGDTLLESMQRARPDLVGHSVPQSLLRGFSRRSHQLRAYLAARAPRQPPVPPAVPPQRSVLAMLVQPLLDGFDSTVRAFEHHGRLFQHRFGLGLA
jgi:hypothetical protein